MLRVMSISLTETHYEYHYDISTEKYNKEHYFLKKSVIKCLAHD